MYAEYFAAMFIIWKILDKKFWWIFVICRDFLYHMVDVLI